MGYTTWFDGYLELDPQPTAVQVAEVNKFYSERHDAANPLFPDDSLNVHGELVTAFPDAVRCQWRLTELADGRWVLEWDGEEKFYDYVRWLRFLVSRFFAPWGISLSGEIEWQGEDDSDCGKIVVAKSAVRVLRGATRVEYAEERDDD